MPREAAERMVQSSEAYAGRVARVQRLLDQYAGVDSLEQLERLTTREVAIRWLQAGQPDHLLNRGSMTRRGCVGTLAPQGRPPLRVAAGTTSGAVAYVLLRGPVSGPPRQLLTLWQNGSSWRIKPDDVVQQVTSPSIHWTCPR